MAKKEKRKMEKYRYKLVIVDITAAPVLYIVGK